MLIEKIHIQPNHPDQYPLNLPLFQKEVVLNVNNAVTVFVGENGSGKSSLLKLLQGKLGLIEIQLPGQEIKNKINAKQVTLSPSLGKLKGFFFESLSFINYIEYIQKEIADSMKEIQRIDEEYKGKSDYVKSLAKSPFARTIGELKGMYSKDLSQSSHGEAYLDFFSSRIRDKQIYLLDEPETPLSVQNQLTLMAMILEATKRGCQFIIATHSPILAAIPDSLIYEIKDNEFVNTEYEEITSISLLKQFLNNKE
ncbi:MAG: AAA family ATPase [Bacilli bacterium]|nr:AAA family ATPase [Bacilli bacterium]